MANLTTNFNYLQPTSFKLVIDRKNYPNLEFFCQSFVHPGMIMNSVEVPYNIMDSCQAMCLSPKRKTHNE